MKLLSYKSLSVCSQLCNKETSECIEYDGYGFFFGVAMKVVR
jgi:hypothetical protein